MKLILIACSLLLASPAAAQIFPKTDTDRVAEDIEKAKRGAGTPETPKDPPDGVKPPVKAIDGPAALARFKELRESLRKAQAAEQKESGKTIKLLDDAVADYMEAQVALKLGCYEDAARLFKKITPVSDDKLKELTGEVRQIAVALQNGRHFYFRLVAEVMEHYKYCETDEEFDKIWGRAEKTGQTIIRALQQAITSKQVDAQGGVIQLRRIENWVDEEKNHWLSLRAAEKELRDNPTEMLSWQRFLEQVGTAQREDRTPNFLDSRAALTVIKEFWSADTAVRRGHIDNAIALNYTSVLQFERGLEALTPHDGLDAEGKRYVEDQKRKLQEMQNAVMRELKK